MKIENLNFTINLDISKAKSDIDEINEMLDRIQEKINQLKDTVEKMRLGAEIKKI